MKLICAVDKNWAIGKNNSLLYSIPEDMKFFREKTIGKVIICGRKTLESFPGSKPLPKRQNIVLSSHQLPLYDNMISVASIDELLSEIEKYDPDDVFCCGGSSIYHQLYKMCDELFITKIEAENTEATSFFPNIDADPDFIISASSGIMKSATGLEFSFLTYKNKSI